MQGLKKYIKYQLKFFLGYRPLGLGHLGRYSQVRRPYSLLGREGIYIGDNSIIQKNGKIEAYQILRGKRLLAEIHIEDNVYIGTSATICAAKKIHIGKGCALSDRVSLLDASHGFDPGAGLIMDQILENISPINIGDNSFLGINVCVLPGVTLGNNCVVGASSVVTKSFPPYSMIGGNPARLIKKYNLTTKKWERL